MSNAMSHTVYPSLRNKRVVVTGGGQCLKVRVEPHDVAAMVLFLSSDDARMCTAHEYFVDAGWR
jgi:hypothetical protein